MDFTHHTYDGAAEYLREQRESHWQPALRPDAEDDPLDGPEEITVDAPVVDQERYERTLHPDREPRASQSTDKEEKTVNGLTFEHDDGRLDPAWGIQRVDSARILDGVRRSSSFPKVQAPNTSDSPVEPSAETLQSQEFGSTTEAEEDFGALLSKSSQQQPQDTEMEDAPGTVGGQTREETQGWIAEQDVPDHYGEGLPLIPAESPVEPVPFEVDPSAGPAFNTSTFDAADDDKDVSFFSKAQHGAQEEALQPQLDRKTTEDVLQAMHVAPGTDSPPLLEDDLSEVLEVLETDLPKEDDLWAAVLGDEEDEFLVEDADDLLPESDDEEASSFLATLQPTNSEVGSAKQTQALEQPLSPPKLRQNQSNPTRNAYAPHQPSTAELTQFPVSPAGNLGLGQNGLPTMGSFQNQVQRPAATQREASFVDQSKGGYKSPYDLPMDIAPKKRVQPPRTFSQSKPAPPPPRSSSINSERQLQSPFTPTNTTFGFSSGGPLISPPPAGTPAMGMAQNRVTLGAKPSSSGFFEELPIIAKARPAPASGRYSPAPNITSPPAMMPPPPQRPPPSQVRAIPPRPPSIQQNQVPTPSVQSTDQYTQFQLQPPERLDPYANVSSQHPNISVPTATVSRYSPAPPASMAVPKPTPSPRYSPAPPAQQASGTSRYASQPPTLASPPKPTAPVNRPATQPGQSVPPTSSVFPFQPRTSSPLAQHRKSVDEQAETLAPLTTVPSAPATAPVAPTNPYAPSGQSIPPLSRPPANNLQFSPPRKNDYSSQTGFIPPRRSQTQSPGQQVSLPSLPLRPCMPSNRPMSAYGVLPPTLTASQPITASPKRSHLESCSLDQDLDFIRPTDETQGDRLQRWRGAPVFNFGFGGTIVTCFPKHTPRYSAASTRPQIKPTPGEISIKHVKDVVQLPEHVATFPGPLRGKSKKKDVLTWLTATIVSLESQPSPQPTMLQNLSDPRQRHDEKILLWKLMKVLVENDGNFQAANALKAVNEILMPEIHALDESTASQYHANDEQSGIYRPSRASIQPGPAGPEAVETIRKHLLRGQREDAVWKAVDHQLWSHAMVIASTLDRSVWKQVIQEFVRQEVKPIGNNTESLCALYQIFGGSQEESIDQLVPPSARAGLQMVSTVDVNGPTKNALEGLDRWRETLSLVLNNKSVEDQRALASLGRLLAEYGRVEASHICYLFALSPVFPVAFGGVDDAQSSIVLLGADHQSQPHTFQVDTDATLLTEVYEFASNTLSGTGAAAPMPHLAVYKLQRAAVLADAGMKTEAQAYCEAIAAGLRSSVKQSMYYHPLLLGEVEDLSNRLKQIPVQSSSWMTKPSIEKVSGSVWNKFSSFVTGEDSDAESKSSARENAEAGPFAKVSGSPNLSRSGSQTDLYGSYPSMTPAVPTTSAGVRYAPSGLGSTRSSSELTRGRTSLEQQRSPPSTSHSGEHRSIYSPMYQPAAGPLSPPGTSPAVTSYQPHPLQSSYVPDAQPAHSEAQHSALTHPAIAEQSAYEPTPQNQLMTQDSVRSQPAYQGYVSSEAAPEIESPGGESTGYDPGTSFGYQPPDEGGYVPYQPGPDSEEEPEKKAKPKKSFMDEDNEDFGANTKLTGQKSLQPANDDDAARRKANDEVANAAFRAAVEADAQRTQERQEQKKASGSWLGGWFGGAKRPDSLDSSASSSSKGADQKVYKAKLGESKMKLYYDKDLKKWVNPDAPASSKPLATPPPPRSAGGPPQTTSSGPPMGGPPRSVSTPATGPPSVLRTDSPAADSAGSRPGSSGIAATLPRGMNDRLGLNGSSTPPSSGPLGPPETAPISRPTSSMSTASGLDDLLGGPPTGARKGAASRAAKTKRKGYVDVLAK